MASSLTERKSKRRDVDCSPYSPYCWVVLFPFGDDGSLIGNCNHHHHHNHHCHHGRPMYFNNKDWQWWWWWCTSLIWSHLLSAQPYMERCSCRPAHILSVAQLQLCNFSDVQWMFTCLNCFKCSCRLDHLSNVQWTCATTESLICLTLFLPTPATEIPNTKY